MLLLAFSSQYFYTLYTFWKKERDGGQLPKWIQKRSCTNDPVLCLEDKIRIARVEKVSMVALYFYIEKEHDILLKESLLMKLHFMGGGGSIFNWIMDGAST